MAAKKKKTPKLSFAKVVRRVMSEQHPEYTFLETTGGSGPLVTFERPNRFRAKGLRETVMFQKGLYGADWFRVTFYATFEAPGAMGPTEHSLEAGTELGPDVRWKTNEELENAVLTACKALEKKAAKLFLPFEKHVPKYTVFLGRLVPHYTTWLRAVGEKLDPEMFKDSEDNEIPAFEDFRRWLAKKKLTQGFKGSVEMVLWHFWHGARPMRESDYDKNDYYDCTRCKAFVRRARATLVKRKVPGFGTHFALVCAKH